MKTAFNMIETHIFITLIIFSFLAILLVSILVLSQSFLRINYKINTKKQLFHNILVLLAFITFFISLFCVRLLRINLIVDIKSLYALVIKNLSGLLFLEGLVLLLIVIINLFCYFALIMFLYRKLRICSIRLLLYFRQYEKIKDLCSFYITTKGNFCFLLQKCVLVWTKNPKIMEITFKIWPASWVLLEKTVYFCLLPYLLYFDILVNDAKFSTVFIVLPWYYLYSLWRSFDTVLLQILGSKLNLLTYDYYNK